MFLAALRTNERRERAWKRKIRNEEREFKREERSGTSAFRRRQRDESRSYDRKKRARQRAFNREKRAREMQNMAASSSFSSMLNQKHGLSFWKDPETPKKYDSINSESEPSEDDYEDERGNSKE